MELVVYWTKFAQDKLDDIYDYYEQKVSGKIAGNLIRGIIDRTLDLGKNPNIGQKEALLIDHPEEFRYIVYKNYKIIYWVNTIKNRLDIVNVFDTRQNPIKIEKFK